MTPRILTFLTLAALISGCVGTDAAPPVSPAADDGEADAASSPADGDAGSSPASPPADPSPGSGGSEPATEEAAVDASGAGAGERPPVVRVVPIAWDGRTTPTVCLPSGPGSCMGAQAPFSGDDLQATGVSGRVSGVLTLMWEAQTPAHEQLQLQAWSATSCGDTCWQGTRTLSVLVSGASPLALEFPETVLEAGETVVLTVGPARLPAPDPVVAFAAGEQAFHLEGALRVAT